MKAYTTILLTLFLSCPLFSQKNPTLQASNLNLSKSNINRMIYPGTIANPTNAQALLAELDKAGPMDTARMRTWLVSNFKRFNIDPMKVKQISIYSGRQFTDCTICKQNCKGRCVQDPGSDCICYYHSEPNLRMVGVEKVLTLIYLSTEITDETKTMDLIASTVKSSKSNSSE